MSTRRRKAAGPPSGRPRRYSALPPSLHLGSCRASSSDSGKKDSRIARDPESIFRHVLLHFTVARLPRSGSAHTCGPLRLSSSAMFALHNASDTRSPSCRGVVQKEGQPSDPPGDADPGDADRGCIARRNALPRYTAADVKLASVAASIPFCGAHRQLQHWLA